MSYAQAYTHALSDPASFWGTAAQEIDWIKPYDTVLDESNRWFSGGMMNTCYNALDRHIERGRGKQAAILYDSPVTDTIQTITFQELQESVALLAGALRNYDVTAGDRVLIYMPMIPQAVIAMLACARIGAIHSVVFGGFAAPELMSRIDHAKPKVCLSASCGIEGKRILPYKPILDQAIATASHTIEKCVIYQRPQETAILNPKTEIDWNEALANATPAECVPVLATDPLYILYTSGTTGQPKGVVRDNGGHAVAMNWSMRNIYNAQPGEVFWAASDIGWVVGHSYIVYAPLIYGCTTVVFEGKPVGTPDPGTFWRVVNQHRVQKLFTAPTALRAIKREDPQGEYIKRYDLSRFETLFLAGERSDPNTVQWAEEHLKVSVIDHWWQTETGWAIAANPMGIEHLPVKYGSACRPVPGWDIRCHNDLNQPVAPGQTGNLIVKLPLPPGVFSTLWQAHDVYLNKYLNRYPGFYESGDAGFIDEDGYVFVMARTDDIINVAGHRLSTGAMEEVLSSHPDVAECAVIGVADALKGQIPLGFLVLKAGTSQAGETITQEVVQMVRQRIGAVAAFKQCLIVDQLPKTRSGKILRGTMQKIANSQEFNTPPTIDDPNILSHIETVLKSIGYAQNPNL